MQKETRKKVKIQGLFRPRVKTLTGYKKVPWLTLTGSWLEKIGFNIGSVVEIISSENQLIIKKESEDEQLKNT
jgi:hypothetical protein